MPDLWNDVKHALHLFIKSPGFTIAAVAALALVQATLGDWIGRAK